MHNLAFCLDSKLHIVAIGTVYNPDSLDLLYRECSYLLLGITNQPQASNTAPIGEGDMLPIRL
jgi:hypothetical protein